MAFSHFDIDITPEEILQKIPVLTDKSTGEDYGSANPMVAKWCIDEGFDVTLYTADFQIIDQSWTNLDKSSLLARMRQALPHRADQIPSMGRQWAEAYMQAYIDFIEADGTLKIIPHFTSGLIDKLLEDGPVLACVCMNVMYGIGRVEEAGLRKFTPNDISGRIYNHTVVIYGKDDTGYKVADPWQEPGRLTVNPELLLASIHAAQIECDTMLFQLHKRS